VNQTLSKDAIRIWRALAVGSLYFFSRSVLGYDKLTPTLHGDLCRFVQDRKVGVALTVMPRSFYKSTVVSIAYPLWRAVQNPDIRVLITSKSAALASKSIDEIRGHVQGNELFQLLFPEVVPNFRSKLVRWSSHCACLSRPREWKEGTFEAAGAGSRIVGRHYDIIIEDDPVYPEYDQMTGQMSEPSDADIQKAIGWHDLRNPLAVDWSSLLTLIAGTRWKRYDFINHVKTHTQGLQLFERSAVENGKPIFPEQYNLDVLDKIRADTSRYVFASQYLCHPVADEDIVFRPEWIHTFDRAPSVPRKVITVDPAISMKEKACYSALVCTGVSENNRRYVLDAWHGRVNAPDLVRQIFGMVQRNFKEEDKYHVVGIESVTYQQALAQFCREEMVRRNYFFTIVELQPKRQDRDKDHRIQALVPYFENGAIYIRAHMHELRRQLTDYPGPYVDLVDALAWHLPLVRSRFPDPVLPVDKNPFLIDNILEELRNRGQGGPILYGCKTLPVDDAAFALRE